MLAGVLARGAARGKPDMPTCRPAAMRELYMATIDLTLDLLIHLLAFLSYIGIASYSLGVS